MNNRSDDDDVHVMNVHMATTAAAKSVRTCDLDVHAQHRIDRIDTEIALVDEQLGDLHKRKQALRRERAQILAQQCEASATDAKTTNYVETSQFPWSAELSHQAKSVFGIESFRSCQEAVCNAVMDRRDIMVVMPTGAGKSLCYQLPALLSGALFVVISPLIALMTDQVYHLRERGVSCELLSSSMSSSEMQAILQRVRSGTNMPRLLYVTPERIVKSKTLLATLQRVYEAGRLERIVVDEAHCCSMMGHDYRPDYHKLSICQRLFPETPMMGLTATLSAQALCDVLQILGMRDSTTQPTEALPRRTVYFRAPLSRPNLKYSVRMRPTNALATQQMVTSYILQHHAEHSGIVYCLSRKDTHTMSEALTQLSHGQILTGVYHSDLDEVEKHRVHTMWRTGEIKVVCATIAFGMGIDKGDVRFVVHACISKSLEGYYQETGRAGRDGLPADCVLLYRTGDLSRLSAMTASEVGALDKCTYIVLRFSYSGTCMLTSTLRYDSTCHAILCTVSELPSVRAGRVL